MVDRRDGKRWLNSCSRICLRQKIEWRTWLLSTEQGKLFRLGIGSGSDCSPIGKLVCSIERMLNLALNTLAHLGYLIRSVQSPTNWTSLLKLSFTPQCTSLSWSFLGGKFLINHTFQTGSVAFLWRPDWFLKRSCKDNGEKTEQGCNTIFGIVGKFYWRASHMGVFWWLWSKISTVSSIKFSLEDKAVKGGSFDTTGAFCINLSIIFSIFSYCQPSVFSVFSVIVNFDIFRS